MRFGKLGVGIGFGLLVGISGLAASSEARSLDPLPNYDAYRADTAKLPPGPVTTLLQGFLPSTLDRRMAVPTFLWASAHQPVAAVGALQPRALVDARAREYLRRNATTLHLSDQMIADAELLEATNPGRNPVIARYRQRVNGREVFNRRLNVLMNAAGEPVAISGYFATDYQPADIAALRFNRSGAQGVAAALANLGATVLPSALSVLSSSGGYDLYNVVAVANQLGLSRQPRVKAIYYPRIGRLEPAYYIELFGTRAGGGPDLAMSFVISASDGALLFRKNLTAYDAYTYRVFADAGGIHQPYDSPMGNGNDPFPGSSFHDQLPRASATAQLITLDHGPISTSDPWIAASGATTTTGNNVDAFLDTGFQVGVPLNTPVPLPGDGYVPGTGDSRVANTGPNTFDYPIQADDDPSTDNAKNAANVNLFYMNNWLHDWWYDHGFNEVSGNAQTSNFGRGGVEGDAISAQGQDSSGRNNANMATPADGSSPRMQMYLFDGAIQGGVTVTSPAALGTSLGSMKFNGASFGPQTFDVTGDVAIAADLFDPPSDGCTGQSTPPDPLLGLSEPIPNPVPDPGLFGKIAFIDRGTCNFTSKELFATVSGATAMVVINNGAGDPTSMGNGDVPLDLASTDKIYQLPAIMIRKEDGQKIKDAIAAGQTVTMHIQRLPSIDRDGTLDEQVIAHEFFHHVSNRLVGDGSGLDNNQGGGMGEGWSDVNAMLMTVRPEDRSVAGNDHYQGAYGLAAYVVGDFYFGIRRTPYSTQFSIDPLTFKHIADGVALPSDQAPIAYGEDGSTNSEVHATGEVWANMVWECYAAILNDPRHSFEQARSNMMDYLIGGLKMTPTSPTLVEARDAILAVAKTADAQDYNECAHGFAKRGIGKGAVAPARDSTDNTGVIESYADFDLAPVGGGTTGGTTTGGETTGGGTTGGGTTGGGTTGGGTTGGGTTGGGTTGGGTTGSTAYQPHLNEGGGAFNLALLLPLLGLAAIRRRRQLR